MQNPTQTQPESIRPPSEKEIKFSKNENVMTISHGNFKGKYRAAEIHSFTCKGCFFNQSNDCYLPTNKQEEFKCFSLYRKMQNLIVWKLDDPREINSITKKEKQK